MKRKRTERVTVKVLPETKKCLRRAAERRGLSMSELVRRGMKNEAFEEFARSRDKETADDG